MFKYFFGNNKKKLFFFIESIRNKNDPYKQNKVCLKLLSKKPPRNHTFLKEKGLGVQPSGRVLNIHEALW
jgi:hypothetical protein